MAQVLEYWVLGPGQEATIEAWWGNPPQWQGARIFQPMPRFSSGPWDVIEYGTKVDLGGIVYRVKIRNQASSSQAFNLFVGGVT